MIVRKDGIGLYCYRTAWKYALRESTSMVYLSPPISFMKKITHIFDRIWAPAVKCKIKISTSCRCHDEQLHKLRDELRRRHCVLSSNKVGFRKLEADCPKKVLLLRFRTMKKRDSASKTSSSSVSMAYVSSRLGIPAKFEPEISCCDS